MSAFHTPSASPLSRTPVPDSARSFLRRWVRTSLSALWLCQPVSAVTVDWAQGPGGVSVAADGTGNAYTVRYEYNPAGDIRLVKHNAQGDLLWDVTYDQTDPTKWDRAESVSCDPQGNAIVCGTLMSGYSSPVRAASILMKFSANGNLLWRQVFDGAFDGSSTRKCLSDGDGNIYVFGLGMGPSGLVTRVKSFAPDGTVRWDWFDSAGIGAPLHFKFTADRALLMTCRSVTGSLNGYAKVDLQGNTLWSLAAISSIAAGDAAGDVSGNTYLVHGTTLNGGGTMLRKLDAQGTQIWSVTHPFGGFRVEVGTDDQPVACGFSQPASGSAAFVKFDTAGNVIWQNLNADGNQTLLLHAQLLLDSQNNAYLAAGLLTSMAVCKVNHDGSHGWLSAAGMGSSASAMALGPDGKVFITGGETLQLGQPWTPRLPSLDVSPNQPSPRISLVAEPGRIYRIEFADDLGDWQPACMMLMHGPKQGFIDTDTAAISRRFYRAVGIDGPP